MIRGEINKKLFDYYDEHPEATPTQAARALGVGRNTAASSRSRWKKKRGYKIGTRKEPIFGLVKIEPERIEAQVIRVREKPTLEQLLRACETEEELGTIIAMGLSSLYQELERMKAQFVNLTAVSDGKSHMIDDLNVRLRKALQHVSQLERERDQAHMEYKKLLQRHNEIVEEIRRKQRPRKALDNLKRFLNSGRASG